MSLAQGTEKKGAETCKAITKLQSGHAKNQSASDIGDGE